MYFFLISECLHYSPCFCQAPPLLNPQNAQAPLFGQFIGFSWTPTSKNRIFQWTAIFKFFIHNLPHLLKVTKFLVKISQFMTKKNIFVYKFFVIKYFRFQFIF